MDKSFLRLFLFPILLGCIALTACNGEKDKAKTKSKIESSGYPDVDSLSTLIQEDSMNAKLFSERAALLHKYKNYPAAIYDMANAMRIDSVNAGFHHQLTDIYLDFSQSKLALRTMERAVKLFPKSVPTLLKMGQVQLILKQHTNALESFHNVIQIDPGNSDAFLYMGTTLLEMGETVRAQKAFEKSTALDSRQLDAWINLAQMKLADHNKQAIDYIEAALRIDSMSMPALHTKALYMSSFDQIPEAIALYRKMFLIDPKYTDAPLNAGILLFGLDSLDSALGMFDQAINQDPFKVQAYYYRGLVKENTGDLAGAKIDYKKATQMVPDYEKALDGLKRLEKIK